MSYFISSYTELKKSKSQIHEYEPCSLQNCVNYLPGLKDMLSIKEEK